MSYFYLQTQRQKAQEGAKRTQQEVSSAAMAEATNNKKLHVVMFPWLAFGHIIPYLQLAKLLAQKGHRISFVSTPRNIQRLPPHPSPLITFVELPLPHDHNLPENAESTMDVPPHKVPHLKTAFDALQRPLSLFLETAAPDWIIYDFAPHWLPPIAAKLRIPRAFFSAFNAWTITFFGPPSTLLNDDVSRTEPRHFTVPPKWITFPSKIVFRLYEIKKFFSLMEGISSDVSDTFRLESTAGGADAYLIRGCVELQRHWLDLLAELYQKPVVPVGLMPPQVEDSGEGTWPEISRWMDRQVEGSVVYVAFGSEGVLSQEELTELALGVELSGLPFFWALAVRRRTDLGEPETIELPEGFEDRTKGRGVVWTSWVPQLRILGHKSVGGFLTHCGSSSIIEGLQFGLPLIMFPLFGEQSLNARWVEELEAGIEIARGEEDGSLTGESVANTLKMVIEGDEGRACRERARALREIFGDHDLQAKYTDQFVGYLEEHRPS